MAELSKTPPAKPPAQNYREATQAERARIDDYIAYQAAHYLSVDRDLAAKLEPDGLSTPATDTLRIEEARHLLGLARTYIPDYPAPYLHEQLTHCGATPLERNRFSFALATANNLEKQKGKTLPRTLQVQREIGDTARGYIILEEKIAQNLETDIKTRLTDYKITREAFDAALKKEAPAFEKHQNELRSYEQALRQELEDEEHENKNVHTPKWAARFHLFYKYDQDYYREETAKKINGNILEKYGLTAEQFVEAMGKEGATPEQQAAFENAYLQFQIRADDKAKAVKGKVPLTPEESLREAQAQLSEYRLDQEHLRFSEQHAEEISAFTDPDQFEERFRAMYLHVDLTKIDPPNEATRSLLSQELEEAFRTFKKGGPKSPAAPSPQQEQVL